MTEWDEAIKIATTIKATGERNASVAILARQFLAAVDRIATLEARKTIAEPPGEAWRRLDERMVMVETRVPADLLARLKAIERALGRIDYAKVCERRLGIGLPPVKAETRDGIPPSQLPQAQFYAGCGLISED